jgi:transcription elongation GreA/GreB family factor
MVPRAEVRDARSDRAGRKKKERAPMVTTPTVETSELPAVPERDGEVEVGERVTVLDLVTGTVSDYRVVSPRPDAPAVVEVPADSPVAAALLGRHVGDLVEIETVAGVARLEVVEIDG